ncbi:MAG: hypothetical protein FJ303_11455 [Planctomycetes bacterium]|nr:hypothetical protein [Planctomycetota bacterium]
MMWTGKRILILIGTLGASLIAFTIYAVVLGGIDGVQPLPVNYLPQPDEEWVPPLPPPTDKYLQMAFGSGCPELQRPLRLFDPGRGIAFVAGECVIDKGKVRLAPFSAAVFHKSKSPTAHPEISTIRCETALLTLDRPVTQFAELSNRKVKVVEMEGKRITLNNNRGTIEQNDDIDVLIINGALIYEERYDLIKTDGVVCLTDHQAKPPTVISGHGLKMFLSKDSSPNRPKSNRPNAKGDSNAVERIQLMSDVDMRFWVEPGSGFLGGTPNVKKAPTVTPTIAKVAPADKAQIHIRTAGPFVYDLVKETAWFESPARDIKPVRGGDRPGQNDQVSVERIQKTKGGEKIDQLTCDRLDLQFRRKVTPVSPQAGGDKEIETARATRRDVNQVVLALVSEGIDAYGNEMIYRAGDHGNGPLTILRGDPLLTAKDGHKMVCKELHLHAANHLGEGQKAWAKGPGQIDMLDSKNLDKNVFPMHVLWRDTLDVVKVKEGGQVFDLMTVVGEASFIDDIQKQQLHGEKILVWMWQAQESERKVDATFANRQEVRRVLAVDRVRASAPEYVVRKANRLTITFLPKLAPDRGPTMLPTSIQPTEKKGPMAIVDNAGTKIVKTEPTVEAKKAPPIELEAKDITVAIADLGPKKDLQELIAKENVYVFQPGDKPGEKRLDITGTLLTVRGNEQTRTMIVYGEKDRLAQVEVGDTIIWGPVVIVNQADNKAEVDGMGAMDMPSNKSVDGSPASKKNTRIRIDWKKNMTFDGMYARFYGGVQAREHGAHSRALCEILEAKLDKNISFKDGQKKDADNAKIDRLVFDKNVFIEDYKLDDKKQPLQYSKLQGWVLINHEEGRAHVRGPGWVKLLAKGSPDQNFAPAGQPGVVQKPPPSKLEWKLTHVRFGHSMNSIPRPDGRKTTFFGENAGVEVFHFSTVNIDAAMNPDQPPEGGLYLRCDDLVLEGKQNADRTTHIMIATRNVYFRTDKHVGYADIMKFDEVNDRVILEGVNGNPVRLYEVNGDRLVPASIKSSKVLYNRRTGQIDTEGVKSISN